MEQITKSDYGFIATISAFFRGTLYFFCPKDIDIISHRVFYSWNEEEQKHIFVCPALDYETYIPGNFTRENAWRQVQDRMNRGLW